MEIFWSDTAKANLSKIFEYYNEVAGNKVAQAIIKKIILKPRILSLYPESGQKEEIFSLKNRGYRYLIEGNYKIVYKIYPAIVRIQIAAVFDTRQNPNKLKVLE